MWNNRFIHSLIWLTGSVLLCALAARMYHSATAPKGAGTSLLYALLFMGMFLKTAFGKSKLKTVYTKPEEKTTDVGDGLTDIQRIERILRVFSRSGIPFTGSAKSKIIDEIIEHFPEKKATHTRIFDCIAGLLFQNRVYNTSFAAAHVGDSEQVEKALNKLGKNPAKTIYQLEAYYMKLFVRLSEEELESLNKKLKFSGLAFRSLDCNFRAQTA